MEKRNYEDELPKNDESRELWLDPDALSQLTQNTAVEEESAAEQNKAEEE